jgi:hypothetical protein
MYNIKLVVIFNHNYEQHVPTLDALYANQFPDRSYLVPFSTSDRGDVIRVFEDGRTFSGHVAQGHNAFKSPAATHYLFIADDMILNPSISSSNLHQRLQLRPDEAYIKSIAPISKANYLWIFATRVLESVRRAGFDYSTQLPHPKLALKRFAELGIECGPVSLSLLRSWDGRYRFRDLALSPLSVVGYLRQLCWPQPYPLLFGYSDFFLVPAPELDQFAHFCGVFAAMNVFAEVAVPTAMALACPKIKTELLLGEAFQHPSPKINPSATMQGCELWKSEIGKFEQSFKRNLPALLRGFPADQMYIHPIKLSRWSLPRGHDVVL